MTSYNCFSITRSKRMLVDSASVMTTIIMKIGNDDDDDDGDD